MTIEGKVHCFFEQSGTFKNEFIKLGIPAEDYDIQNNFGQTDHVVDLFGEIENAYDGKPSLFDGITSDDLVIAFFPCIYFCQMSQYAQSLNYTNYRNLSEWEACDKIIERQQMRQKFLEALTKMIRECLKRKIRLVVENPVTGSFLMNYFLKSPTIVDNNRMLRGDFFTKPTGYWFWNCEPTHCETIQCDKEKILVEGSGNGIRHGSKLGAGTCNEERSMISPDYARNFIADFILGSPCGNKMQQPDFFD